MEIWELQKQQMVEKHQAYLDTLDHIKSVTGSWRSQPEQTAQPDRLGTISTAMSALANLDAVDNFDQVNY